MKNHTQQVNRIVTQLSACCAQLESQLNPSAGKVYRVSVRALPESTATRQITRNWRTTPVRQS